jgi:predicted nucleic acid-binding protein
MKYVVDTSLVNKLVDGSVHATELPSDGVFVASHIQYDEICNTKNYLRKVELLKKFTEMIDELLPSESLILNTSRLDKAELGEGNYYSRIKSALDSSNNNKRNNSEDALIAEIAMKNEYVLLTADYHLYQVAYRLGIGVMYWTTT